MLTKFFKKSLPAEASWGHQMHQICFAAGSAPDPAGGAYDALKPPSRMERGIIITIRNSSHSTFAVVFFCVFNAWTFTTRGLKIINRHFNTHTPTVNEYPLHIPLDPPSMPSASRSRRSLPLNSDFVPRAWSILLVLWHQQLLTQNVVFHVKWPKLPHPASRSLCDSSSTYTCIV